MAAKSIVFASQIELPVAADHEKSPIRFQELNTHINSEQHIQNDGLPNQLLVMTAVGPRLMSAKLKCACDHGGGPYSDIVPCQSTLVFSDQPSMPPEDVVVRCYKNGLIEVPNESSMRNIPCWTLKFDNDSTFFRFVPEKVFDCNLSQLSWGIVDNVATNLTGITRLISERVCIDVFFDMSGPVPFDDYLVTGVSGQAYTNMMRIRISR